MQRPTRARPRSGRRPSPGRLRRGTLVLGVVVVATLPPAAVAVAPATHATAVSATSTPTPLLPTAQPLPADGLAPGSGPDADPAPPGGPDDPVAATPGAPWWQDLGAGTAGALLLALLWAATIASRTRSRLHTWASPGRLAQLALLQPPREDLAGAGGPAPSARVDAVVPARHVGDQLDRTVEHVTASVGVDLHVVVVVADDDPTTLASAREVAARAGLTGSRVEVVSHAGPWTEPAAVDTALHACDGELLVVLEPGDVVHPQLLATVAGHVAVTGDDVLQTGVQRLPLRGRWWEWQDSLDDHFRYRSELPRAVRRGFVAAGGPGLVHRRAVLREHRGLWSDRLGEVELVTRLQARGARVDARYDARLATVRPAARALGDVLRRRTREAQAMLQALRAGQWRDLPTRRTRLLALRTLGQPVVPVLGVLLAAATVVVAVAAAAPAVLLLPAAALGVAAVVDAVALSQLGGDHGSRVGARGQVVTLVGAAPFRLLLAVAAVRATVREVLGRRDWPVDRRGPAPAVDVPAHPRDTEIDLRDQIMALDSERERTQSLSD